MGTKIKLSQIKNHNKCKHHCEECPFDSTFSKNHWMTVGYFCRIDDYQNGVEEDREYEPPTEKEAEFYDCMSDKDIMSMIELYEENNNE